jgi:hypothetical protein
MQEALGTVETKSIDVCVIVSPHGVAGGVYEETRGSLRSFGVPGGERHWSSDLDFSKRLAESWGRPVVSPPVDHGVFVPLLLWGAAMTAPVVGVTLAERADRTPSGWDEIRADADELARALRETSTQAKTLVVASCNTSIGLTHRAPLTEMPESRATEEALLARMDRPLDELVGENVLADLWMQGSCAPGPLAVLRCLWPQAGVRVAAYAAPVGVGYLVGTVDV